jgi:DNA-binding NarL/FixJ family response regulator
VAQAGTSGKGGWGNPDRGEALVFARALSPQVVLMDLSLTQMVGITASAVLHEAIAQSAVVFRSLQDDLTRRAQTLAAGACSFVGKQEEVNALFAAIYMAGSQGHQSHRDPARRSDTGEGAEEVGRPPDQPPG